MKSVPDFSFFSIIISPFLDPVLVIFIFPKFSILLLKDFTFSSLSDEHILQVLQGPCPLMAEVRRFCLAL